MKEAMMILSAHVRAFLFATLGIAAVLAPACSSKSDDNSQQDIASIQDPLKRGELYMGQRDCADCHKNTDGTWSGQDTTADNTKGVYGANLTSDSETGIGDWSEAVIKTAILTGIDDEGQTLCAPMKKFGMLGMSDNEASDIAKYLKSLKAV